MNKWLFLIFICQSTLVWSQTLVPLVEYSGGVKEYERVIFKYLSRHNGLFANSSNPDSARKLNKYFSILIKVEKDGLISDDIVVNSYNDSTASSVIVQAVKETNGKWINHTGVSQWVVLPLFYVYDGDDVPKEKIPLIRTNWYNGFDKREVIYFDRLLILMGPTYFKQ